MVWPKVKSLFYKNDINYIYKYHGFYVHCKEEANAVACRRAILLVLNYRGKITPFKILSIIKSVEADYNTDLVWLRDYFFGCSCDTTRTKIIFSELLVVLNSLRK